MNDAGFHWGGHVFSSSQISREEVHNKRRSTKHQKKCAWLLCGLHPLSYWHLLHLGDGPQTTGVAGIPQTKSCSLSMPKVVVPQAVCSVHMISKSRKGYRCADSLVQAAHITCGMKDIITAHTFCRAWNYSSWLSWQNVWSNTKLFRRFEIWSDITTMHSNSVTISFYKRQNCQVCNET